MNKTLEVSQHQAALDRLAAEGGEAWKPTKAGERITVEVQRIEQRTVNTSQGAASAIVVTGVDEKGDLRDIWCWHTVLRNEMIQAAPQPGDVIAVEYKGKIKAAGGGNGYHGYKVARADDKAGGEFNWGAQTAGVDQLARPEIFAQAEPAAPVEQEDDIPF